MLAGADAYNQDISNWDTSSVTDMTQMFIWNDAFDQNLGAWNTSSLIACDDFWNPGCNPSGVVELGCADVPDQCCSTQVAHSNYASADSIQGNLNDVVELICDQGYVGGGEAVCSDVTGNFMYTPCTGTVYIYIYIYIYY